MREQLAINLVTIIVQLQLLTSSVCAAVYLFSCGCLVIFQIEYVVAERCLSYF
jgi:hypothetical protein